MNPYTLGVSIAVDRAHTSVAVAGLVGDVRVFTLAAYLPGSDTADQVAALTRERALDAVVIDPRSPAATLIAPLQALGLTVTETTPRDLAIAHGSFLDELRAGRLKAIDPHPALTAAVQHAAVRPLAGADALERRKVEADASPLEAVELAVWRLLNKPPEPGLFIAIT